LVAIIGKIGSGKTSLLNALFGEMYAYTPFDQPSPQIILHSNSISYVPQTSWIQSKTIKENILFYKDFDEKLYNQVLQYSQLITDFKEMPDKDMTMLGDKGVNLSGGQKTRVSIARALYADKEIVIMDDPISALDVHVGKEIMEETVIGHLKEKTRVIVTHNISYLSFFDYVYIMDKGKIVRFGDYEFIKETEEFKEI